MGLCTIAVASELPTGIGIMMSVWEEGLPSPHYEQVWFGLIPADFLCGVPFDPLSQVHLSLPNGYPLDFRPVSSPDRTFTSNIWWTGNSSKNYALELRFMQGDEYGFSWRYPTIPPRVVVREGSKESWFTIPLSSEPVVFHGSGNAEVAVDLGASTPEPSAFLILGSGVLGLILRRKLT